MIPPQSDTVVEVSEKMRALVSAVASQWFDVGDYGHSDSDTGITGFCDVRDKAEAAKAALLQEIARLEEKVRAYRRYHNNIGRAR